ncbi:SGNH/GDSL hydrolase family protein [Foetidibacter luteolus]|uniref:SGNH/GDSL hydrolase family protein n=1 Tax=Foetidibacter luteolus TaxID=2608880 RepID=UPI00129B5121|nr:GDSL-type esterase/lipase family protein [Foetidibacter luteolus]
MNNKLVLLGTFILLLVMASFVADKKKKVVFFGDSITQAGVGPKGYITVLDNMLKQQGISNYELVGAGIGGNKVYDLYLRMEDDVISKSPDIVVIYVGVNDVWHKSMYGTGTDADKFEKFYRALIKKLQAAGAKIVVCTPAAIGEKTDFSNSQDGELNKFCNIIRKVAADVQVPLVDLRQQLLDYNKANNPQNLDKGILTTDGVHLNDTGNEFVAKAMWDKLKDVK